MKKNLNNFEVVVVATMSSGKSTLINSLLGKELIHCANEATTATITRINDSKGLSKMTGFAYGKCLEKIGRLRVIDYSYDVNQSLLQDWNAQDSIYYINLSGNFPHIRNESKNLIFYDSPGPNNSQDQSHHELTRGFLEKARYNLILYVLNATQIGINDDKYLLEDVREILKKDKSKKIVFALNKADTLDEERGETLESFISNANNYLQDLGFNHPTIIPISALSALNARKALNNEAMTRSERNSLQQNLSDIFDDKFIRTSINIPNSLKASEINTPKEESTITLSNGTTLSKSKVEKLVYFSGIPLLESFIHHNCSHFHA